MFFKPQKNLVGIDIGSSSVKMVELKEINGEYHLENIGMASIPSEAIVDNTIMESISIVEAIKGLIKANKIKTKNVSSSISGSSVIIRKILLPVMSSEELDSTIQWEAEQYIPFEMSDVNIDYQILGPSKNDATQMNILLVAAKKDVINDYVMMFHELGMVLKVVDVDGFALENSYEENYEGSKEGIVALINIGASAVNVNVVQDGMSVFTRDLQAGGNMINDELQKNLGLSGEKAEMVKLGEKVDGVDPAAALEVIERAIDNLCLEIQRSLDFFSATSADDQVEKVFISGGVSINPRVRESLEVVLGIPVRVMDPFVRIHLDEGRSISLMSFHKSLFCFFYRLGHEKGGRKMIRINLLPVRDLQKKEKIRDQLLIAALALVVVLLGCGGLYAFASMKISAEKNAIQTAENEIRNLQKTLGKIAEFKKLQKELEGKLGVLQKLKENKSGPARMLDELASSVNDKVWLISFVENNGAISIDGVGLNEQSVASFLQRLEASPNFRNVELSVTELTSGKGMRVQKFKATCRVQEATPIAQTASSK